MSKDFEAMKAGKLAIRHWLVCQYNKHTLADLPSSVAHPKVITTEKEQIKNLKSNENLCKNQVCALS